MFKLCSLKTYHVLTVACSMYCFVNFGLRRLTTVPALLTLLDCGSLLCLGFFGTQLVVSLAIARFRPPRLVFWIDMGLLLVYPISIPVLTGNVLEDLVSRSGSGDLWVKVFEGVNSLQLVRYYKCSQILEGYLVYESELDAVLTRALFEEVVIFILVCALVLPYSVWPIVSEAFWFPVVRAVGIGLVICVSYQFVLKGGFRKVLRPIESMVQKVDLIRKDPMSATRIDRDKERRAKDMDRITQLARLNTAAGMWGRWKAKRAFLKANDGFYAGDLILDQTLGQLGDLLAVGFGPAGARIVAENMKSVDSMAIHAMVPGRKVEAVFGHFKIEEFDRLTKALQDKVLIFVNKVCEIVHGVADEFHGVPNRSNGDSILVVWMVPSCLAVAACVKIQIALARSIELWEYGRLPSLIGFKLRVTMGLHYGWAIEGAIGSNLKIDPTYLSPDVNMASNLQAQNEIYKTNFLASESLVMSSGSMQKFFRQIGEKIFSFDLDLARNDLLSEYEVQNAVITGPRSESPDINVNTHLGQYRVKLDRERRKQAKLENMTEMAEFLTKDRYFRLLREPFTTEFFRHFQKGFLNYACGEFDIAKNTFEQTVNMLVRQSGASIRDGPSEFMLKILS